MEEKELKMESKKDINIKTRSWMQFIIAVSAIIIIASFLSFFRIRLDLTEDNRYTLSSATHKVLDRVKNDIYIQVFFDGDMPVPLKRLRRSVKEMLDEFRIISGRKIDFEFINPADTKDEKERNKQFETLYNKGLIPINIKASDEEGGASQKMVFPGMLINYNGVEIPVNFLKNNQSLSSEQNILHSIEGLEYEIIQTIATASSDTVYRIAFIEGQDEIPEVEVADITMNLAKYFTIDRGVIAGKTGILDNYAALIIAGPEIEFTETDKFVIDQYIMNGGKVVWLVDEVAVNNDSLAFGATVGLNRSLNIEDQLFRYGVRINPAIIQDNDCVYIRLAVTSGGERQQIVPASWPYFPLLTPSASHPVTRNINKVKGEFTGYIDTVGLDPRVRKTILLSSSAYSRTLTPPLVIQLKEAELALGEKDFNKSFLPVAVLLEGRFYSAFRNRMTDNLLSDKSYKVRNESAENKMIVIADADIIRNEVKRVGTTETPLNLGQDKYTGEMFGNRDFLLNCMNYLVDDDGIMELRSREIKMRLLNTTRVKKEKLLWQTVNIAGPVVIVLLAGLFYSFLRKKAYSKY